MVSESCPDQEIAGILPWYVNGTLSDAERRSVEHHLASCAVCQQEIKLLRQVAEALAAEAPVPSSDLYARTGARLAPRGVVRLFQSMRRIVLPVPMYARVALVAELVIIVALVAFLTPHSSLMTLSESPRRLGPGVQIQVIFSTGATVGQIQQVLTSLNARIVDGPSPLGIYAVEIPLGPRSSVSTAEEALRTLRASPLVQFAGIVEERR